MKDAYQDTSTHLQTNRVAPKEHYTKKVNKPSSIHEAFKLILTMVSLASDVELVAAGLLVVTDAPPFPDEDGIVDGDELPTLLVALPSARKMT